MTLRRTITWVVLLLLVATGAVAGYVQWSLSRVNEQIREKLLAQLAEMAPHWDVEIDRVRFDWNRTIHVHGFTLKPRGDEDDVATVPEVRITFDREEYDRTETVDVLRVHLVNPTILLVRDPDGGWNWQRLAPLESTGRTSLPEWIVDDANLVIRLRNARGGATELPKAVVDGRVVPSGKRRFEIVGGIDVAGTGTFDLDGRLDVDRGTWSFGGRARDLVAGERLVELASRASPDTRTRIAELDEQLRGWLPEEDESERSGVRVADATDEPPAFRAVGSVRRIDAPTLGVDGRLALEFELAKGGAADEVRFAIKASFDGAQIDHPALPFPLHDVEGRIVWGHEGLSIENFKARNGITRIAAHGAIKDEGKGPAGSFRVALDDVILDERVRSRLTGRLREVYDRLRPVGRGDFSTDIVVDADGVRTENLVLRSKGTELTYDEFAYPLKRATGGVRQEGRDLVIVLDGVAAGVPVAIRGRVHLPTNQVALRIKCDGLPIDERFHRACPTEARDALESLRLAGTTDFTLDVTRPPGADTDWRIVLAAGLRDASVEFSDFPYRCTELSAKVAFDSENGIWWVREIAGRHDDTKLTGTARFDLPTAESPERLQMRIVARNGMFDRQLRLALPQSMQRVWTVLDPTGTLDAVIDVDWSPGGPPDVRVPKLVVTGGTIRPEPLPIKLTDVSMKGAFANERFDVERFEARRDGTRVRATGYYLQEKDERWRLRMDDLYIDDLDPDAEFREALPDSMRYVVDSLNPRGVVSLSGRLEFRGSHRDDDVVTAAWELDGVLPGTTIAAGIDLEKVHGGVTSAGTYDGRTVVAEGNIDCDSLVALGYQFTRVKGPYRVNGARVTLGSHKAFLVSVPPITLEERITAHAIDGMVVLDGIVVTGEEPAYNVKGLLSDGRLESYARRYMPGATNLAGVMNGWVDLHGRGTGADNLQGRGQLQISPAALYELPVMLKLLSAVPFARNQSAFDHALLDFRIARQLFVFDSIDLTGDALVLRGRGTVGFNKDVNLDFYSQRPRRQLPIPLVRDIVGEAARGLVAVYVTGTLDHPQTEVVTAPTINNTLKSFLGPLLQPGAAPDSAMRQNGRR